MLGNDSGEQGMRGHIKSGIPGAHFLRNDGDPGELGDLPACPLFHRDVLPVGQGQVDGGGGQGGIKRNLMVMGQYRQRVCSDLIGKIPVGGHPIAAHDNQVHLALSHKGSRHIVADQGDGDVVPDQLIGGEPGALKQRSGLIGVDYGHLVLLVGGADDPQGGAIAACGKGPGIAMGEDSGALRDKLCAESAYGPIHLHILPVDGGSLPLQCVGVVSCPADQRPHPVQCPEQIDRGGATGSQLVFGQLHLGEKVGAAVVLPRGQDHGIGGGDADGGRAAHHHGTDGLGHRGGLGVGDPLLRKGQLGLVQQRERVIIIPTDGIHRDPSFKTNSGYSTP